MPSQARMIRSGRMKPKGHGYLKCPNCAYKVAPEDKRCPWCDCPFWPKADTRKAAK